MMPEWLSLIDVAFVAVVLFSALGGLQKGFAGQVAQVITFVLFGIALFFAYPGIYRHLTALFRNMDKTYMTWLLLAGLAVLSFLFFILCNKVLASVLKTQISDRSDRSYGFLLGLIRGMLLALFAMILLVILGPPELPETLCAKSQTGRLVCEKLVPIVQPHFNRTTISEDIEKMRESLLPRKEAEFPE